MRKFKFIIPILLTFIFASCKTVEHVYVPVHDTIVNTQYISNTVIDTVIQKDSTYIYVNGDTLIQYYYKDRYHNVYVHDTIVKDSIVVKPQIVVEYKEVNKLTKFQKFLNWFGGISLLSIIGLLIFKLYKKFK